MRGRRARFLLTQPMKVLFASDKFAGTLTAREACEAAAAGWLSQRPADQVRFAPMADGGPGTVEVVAATGLGKLQDSWTVDQVGNPVQATWLSLPSETALIESCSACGLSLVPRDRWRPLNMSSEGVGRLLVDISARGYSQVIVGLGGSGTVDAGMGAAIGMGAAALDRDGEPVEVGGPADFSRIESVTPVQRPLFDVVVATDVANPLLGPGGAARMYGPQKGADSATVEILESRLSHLAAVVEKYLPDGPWRDLPGAGAGGGLGFGLMAWAGARIENGAQMVAELVDLQSHIEWADVVVTGEGSIDEQTLHGKAPVYVANTAREMGRPVAAIAGRVSTAAEGSFDGVEELGAEGLRDPVGATHRAGSRLAEDWIVRLNG